MKPLKLIHIDLQVPSPINSISVDRHFLVFVDDNTQFTWFYLLKTKVKHTVLFYSLKLSLKINLTPKLRLYNLISRVSFTLSTLFSNLGILHRLFCPYTSQQNRRVNREKLPCG